MKRDNREPISCHKSITGSKAITIVTHIILVFVFFLIYGIFQELIFRLKGFKPYGLYLTLYQFLLYMIFSAFERFLRNDGYRKIPLRLYMLLALLTVGTMGLSNSSVGFLNYPTQVVFKCCKLIPVLLGGIIIQGKKYDFIDFLSAILMSLGLTIFTLADSKVSPNFNVTGVVLITSALVADAAIGNLQEKILKQYVASNAEMVFYSYSIGFLYILLLLVCLGQLKSAFELCAQYPKETYGFGFLFSLSGYCGINVVLSLVRHFGAFTTVTITTCRKALTIIISFVIFSKPFTFQYIWSGLIVVCGIYLNVFSKVHHQYNILAWAYVSKTLKWIEDTGYIKRKDAQPVLPM